MFLFNSNLTYFKIPTIYDRERIANVVLNKDEREKYKKMNLIINIVVPIIICLLTDCNLIAAGVSFVLTDIVLLAIDEYLLVIKPHEEILMQPLEETQTNLKKIIDLRDNSLAHDCSSHKHLDDSNMCGLCQTLSSVDTYLEYETDWIENKLMPIKEKEFQEDNKNSQDYENKKEYWLMSKERLNYFASQYDEMDCLAEVSKSIDLLIEAVQDNENGFEMVPINLYLLMDELKKTLNKISVLKEGQKQTCIDDLQKVSSALSQHINDLVKRVEASETKDIEISLAVLLKELTKENMVMNDV